MSATELLLILAGIICGAHLTLLLLILRAQLLITRNQVATAERLTTSAALTASTLLAADSQRQTPGSDAVNTRSAPAP